METVLSAKSGSHAQAQIPPAILQAAQKFEQALHSVDVKLFRTTTLEDVKAAAEIIERDQEQRRCMRSLRRLEPFFQALRRFGTAVDVLCQGTPYLPYIWAPIKLLLQIADEYTVGFTRLVDAYADIAKHLPRFEQLGAIFSERVEFQSILADVYADILEFHQHTYKFLRRSGWKHLFDSFWKGFDGRFNTILRNLAKNQDLLDREANSLDILEAKAYRQRSLDDLEQRERARQDWQLRDTLAWLDLKGQDQEQQELFDRCKNSREDGTCAWILSHPKTLVWLDPDDRHPFTWLRGKPGSGKTTLATFLVEEAAISPDSHMLYCLCSYGFGQSEKNACSLTFRSLIAQLLRKQPDLLSYIYQHYVRARTIPSLVKVKELLKTPLETSERVFLILDGLDELRGDDQKQVLAELGSLASPTRYERLINIKVLVCSRESKDISRKLARSPQVSLSEEELFVQRDISMYTRNKLVELRDRFCDDVVDALEKEVVEKAKGMFLWVRLVLSTLLEEESLNGLRAAIEQLPSGLPGVYKLILDRIRSQANDQQQQRIEQILIWLSFSCRSLKASEICSAIVFHTDDVLNHESKLGKGVLDICKPLVEERENDTIALIHHSAREFLLHRSSGPYLSPLAAHRHITTSCIKYLVTCREFLTGTASPTSYGHIIKGFHDLYPYVQEFWPAHLFDASQGKKDEHIDSELLEQLSRLETAFWRPSRGSSSRFRPTPQTSKIPALVGKYLDFRKATSGQPSESREDDQNGIEQDPTLLSDAHSSFREAFESLINNAIPYSWDEMGVESSELDEFRRSNQKSSFCCRWTGCVWTSLGFPSQKDREEHEILHQKRFVCEDISCDFAHIGFRTAGALRKHARRYHTTEADVTIPEFPLHRSRGPKMARNAAQPSSEQARPENATNSTTVQPSRKKLSLGDYMKRKQSSVSPLNSNQDESLENTSSARSSPLSSPRRPIISDEDSEIQTAAQNAEAAATQVRRDINGRTQLARACSNNDLHRVKIIFRESPEELDVADNAGNTPLHIAALQGYVEVVEFLLEEGCSPNTRNIDRDTPLIDAVENGHVEIIKLLLEHGANRRLGNAKGQEPYDLVPTDDENYEEIRKLIQNPLRSDIGHYWSEDSESETLIQPAQRVGNAEGLASRRQRETTRNDILWQHNTPENLSRLAARGDVQGVGHILNINPKVEPETMIAAAKAGHEEVLQLLLGLGELDPDPDPVPEQEAGYNTPMLAAIGRGHPAIVELLIQQAGFDPRRTFRGRTYYQIAAERRGREWEKEYGILKRAYDGLLREEPEVKRRISENVNAEAVPKRRRLVTGKEFRTSRQVVDDSSSEVEMA